MADPLILIPARLGATRLPNKPLAEIAGEPMIVHVWRRAVEAGIGPVAVATDADEIAAAVRAAGGEAVMTRSDHASGSDRIAEALSLRDPEGRYQHVVNLQGDLPTIDTLSIRRCLAGLYNEQADISTITPADMAEYPLGSILAGGSSGPFGDDKAPAAKWVELAQAFRAAVEARPGAKVPMTL